MNEFRLGDIVHHKTRPFTKMIIIKLKKESTYDKDMGKIFLCRYYDEFSHTFAVEEFQTFELEGMPGA